MSTFGSYAAYYDLLYSEKDNANEAAFVHKILERYCPQSRRVLDLGCGTGRHDVQLARLGLSVCGVDASGQMIERALSARSALDEDQRNRLSFYHDDIRTVRMYQKFDCVVSLFHVISYLTSNEDLEAAFDTIREHLAPGGVCLFDCWYGPAVLNLRPAVRVKELRSGAATLLRIAEPVLRPNRNLVDVNYTLWFHNGQDCGVEIVRETHSMRYLFIPEVEFFVNRAGLQVLETREWITNREPSLDTWGVYFVVRG